MGKPAKSATKKTKHAAQKQTAPQLRQSELATADAPHSDDLKLDTRGDGMYSGTFRWLESKRFPDLPVLPRSSMMRSPASVNNSHEEAQSNPAETPLLMSLAKGWEGYLTTRSDAKTNLVAVASKDPSCLDALSFPITFVHVARLLSLCTVKEDAKTILIIGASSKAEQRIWRITDYWNEIAHFFPTTAITLWFIGPEAHASCHSKPRLPSNLSANHFRGTFGTFQDSHAYQDCTPTNTIIIGYNTGFGNFVDSNYYALLFSWLPDLYKIADSKIPAIFTCANDYADMNGEFAVQSRVVGAKMLLLPQQNPFSCASHLHEEGRRDSAWSRGNSFLYAIQGFDSSRRVELAPGDTASLQKRLDAELDLHLQDALGRHFFKDLVLSKEQASRCKAITGANAKSVQCAHVKNTPPSNGSSAIAALEKPHLQLLSGNSSREVVAVIHIPKVQTPSERIAVDLSDSTLRVVVPGKYSLQEKLPFEVPPGSAANIRAELVLPVLRIAFTRT